MYKNMYRTLLSVFTVCLLVCLLAACGGDGGTPPPGVDDASPSATTARQAHGPLISIRMFANSFGWALTKDGILKTVDGGQHWQSVTPVDGPADYTLARGNFPDAQTAWVADVQQSSSVVTIEHTTDGGAHWQSTTITPREAGGVDMPHFADSEGWLEVMGHPGAGSQGAMIYHSADSGAHWQQISASGSNGGIANGGFKSGISFLSKQTGFATTRSTTGNPTDAGLYKTTDGGTTWTKQELAPPRGVENLQQMGTTPPVFFGSKGLLPVYITTQDGKHLLNLYYTEDSGGNWMARGNATLEAGTVYVLDVNHAWASDDQDGKLYYTTDGGVSWQAADQAPGKFKEMSFVDPFSGWAVTDSALLRTTDGGKTWNTVNFSIQ